MVPLPADKITPPLSAEVSVKLISIEVVFTVGIDTLSLDVEDFLTTKNGNN